MYNLILRRVPVTISQWD